MNSIQPNNNGDDNNQNSNQFSSTSFIPEFVHRQSIKKINSGPAITIKQKIKQFQYDLFISLEIFTPERLKPLQLKKQLKNYQYERVQRKIESQSLVKFGKAEQQLFRQQQNLILMLNSLMRQFRSDKDKYFYILTKKSNKVFYFQHIHNPNLKFVQSMLLICNIYEKIATELQIQKIPYQVIPSDHCQKLLIKNQAINIYWAKIVNKIIEDQKHFKSFYVIANFSFPGGSEVLPTQLFNGLQNKKQYGYIAKPRANILGEEVQEVYRMKIGGIWTFQNVKNVIETLDQLYGQKCYDIQFQPDRITQYLKDSNLQQDYLNKKLF